jgi:hypothetical protein
MEDGLRHGGLGVVVGEVGLLAMRPSRRLQLAAETSGTIGIAIRRWRRPAEAADFGQPTASTARWRVSAVPASPLPVPGLGRPQWFIELIRAKAGECAEFEIESCWDGQHIPTVVASESAALAWIKSRIEPGTIANTDEASGWNSLASKLKSAASIIRKRNHWMALARIWQSPI